MPAPKGSAPGVPAPGGSMLKPFRAPRQFYFFVYLVLTTVKYFKVALQ